MTPLCDHGFAGPRQFAVAAALGREIDDHRAGRHARRPFRAVTSIGRFPAGDGGGGDHDVLLAQHAAQQLALPAVELLVHGLGVAALVLGAGGFHVEHDEPRAQALDLLLHGGAHVVAADHRAQAARGGDRLQSGDARADHQHARGVIVPRRSSASGTFGAARRRRAARPCSRRWSPWRRARPCSGRG